jgi:hypothetical protein
MMPILKMIREYARGPLVEELLLKSAVFTSFAKNYKREKKSFKNLYKYTYFFAQTYILMGRHVQTTDVHLYILDIDVQCDAMQVTVMIKPMMFTICR